jgi:hypothetical protein
VCIPMPALQQQQQQQQQQHGSSPKPGRTSPAALLGSPGKRGHATSPAAAGAAAADDSGSWPDGTAVLRHDSFGSVEGDEELALGLAATKSGSSLVRPAPGEAVHPAAGAVCGFLSIASSIIHTYTHTYTHIHAHICLHMCMGTGVVSMCLCTRARVCASV